MGGGGGTEKSCFSVLTFVSDNLFYVCNLLPSFFNTWLLRAKLPFMILNFFFQERSEISDNFFKSHFKYARSSSKLRKKTSKAEENVC